MAELFTGISYTDITFYSPDTLQHSRYSESYPVTFYAAVFFFALMKLFALH